MNPKPLSVSFLIVPSAICLHFLKNSARRACDKLFRQHHLADSNVDQERPLGYHLVKNRDASGAAALQGAPTSWQYNRLMAISNTDDYGTRQRRDFRAGWVAGLRNESRMPANQENPNLDSHWSQGFRDGTRLRQTWKKANVMRTV